ncbi:hypothetical protein M422DRAFT_263822 [Sphaerobolus stellatus SS14]|uniref:Ubiquitin-like protease family profile domain-containing protein n=1 Tax=Sphaerobolus stellatus (strain SS14) TaxID=990650 RepID=A0A0C9VA14_SPHS4|nr:hypothetical protein M422DRAFT_263822 [Sphaerobolus stellatus SS14]
MHTVYDSLSTNLEGINLTFQDTIAQVINKWSTSSSVNVRIETFLQQDGHSCGFWVVLTALCNLLNISCLSESIKKLDIKQIKPADMYQLNSAYVLPYDSLNEDEDEEIEFNIQSVAKKLSKHPPEVKVYELFCSAIHSNFMIGPHIFTHQEHKRLYQQDSWLNNAIIDGFLYLYMEDYESKTSMTPPFYFIDALTSCIMATHPATNPFSPYSSIQRCQFWIQAVNIFDCHTIIIPWHLNDDHWVTFSIHHTEQKIRIYDSFSTSLKHKHKNILKQVLHILEFEYSEQGLGELSPKWSVNLNNYMKLEVMNNPQQDNGDDCGVFSIIFATALVDIQDPQHADFCITAEDITAMHRNIATHIGHLSPSPSSSPSIGYDDSYIPSIGEWALWQLKPASRFCAGRILRLDMVCRMAIIEPAPPIDEGCPEPFMKHFEKTFAECKKVLDLYPIQVQPDKVMKILWPSSLDHKSTELKENLREFSDYLRPEHLAQLHPEKKRLVVLLRRFVPGVSDVILRGLSDDYADQFSAIMDSWRKVYDKTHLKETSSKIAYQFSLPFISHLDLQDHYLLYRVAQTEVGHEIAGKLEKQEMEITSTVRSWVLDLATRPHIVLLSFPAYAMYLGVKIMDVPSILEQDRVYRLRSLQEEAWNNPRSKPPAMSPSSSANKYSIVENDIQSGLVGDTAITATVPSKPPIRIATSDTSQVAIISHKQKLKELEVLLSPVLKCHNT